MRVMGFGKTLLPCVVGCDCNCAMEWEGVEVGRS